MSHKKILQKREQLSYQAKRALKREDFHQAHRLYSEITFLNESMGALSTYSPFKAAHCIEQIEYLLRKGLIDRKIKSDLIQLKNAAAVLERMKFSSVQKGEEIATLLGACYGRLIHWNPPKRIRGATLNSKLDFQEIEDQFFEQKHPIVVVDRLLYRSCLKSLQKNFLESTLWFDAKPNRQLAARLHFGLSSPLLFQLAAELKARLPRLLNRMHLKTAWAFKYGPQNDGISTHADTGFINFNIWITPDAANLDSKSGGLAVYRCRRPQNWPLIEADSLARQEKMLSYLKKKKAERVVVPHLCNRSVIFDARMFHESDEMKFRNSYLHRRVSLTLAFDRR